MGPNDGPCGPERREPHQHPSLPTGGKPPHENHSSFPAAGDHPAPQTSPRPKGPAIPPARPSGPTIRLRSKRCTNHRLGRTPAAQKGCHLDRATLARSALSDSGRTSGPRPPHTTCTPQVVRDKTAQLSRPSNDRCSRKVPQAVGLFRPPIFHMQILPPDSEPHRPAPQPTPAGSQRVAGGRAKRPPPVHAPPLRPHPEGGARKRGSTGAAWTTLTARPADRRVHPCP